MRLGSRQFLSATKKSKRRAGMLLLFAGVLVMLVLGAYYFFRILRPGVVTMAKAKAAEIATMEVNKAVSEKLIEENITFSDIMTFTYKENGDIASLSGDVARVSRLKSDLAIEVTEAIKSISESSLYIPLGTLSGVDILYGTGPKVPLKIVPYGYAVADIKTDFRDAGINQTIFEVTAEVSAKVSVFMPTVGENQAITASVPVVSAIVVGDVPESYTNVDRQGYEYEEDVLELAE